MDLILELDIVGTTISGPTSKNIPLHSWIAVFMFPPPTTIVSMVAWLLLKCYDCSTNTCFNSLHGCYKHVMVATKMLWLF